MASSNASFLRTTLVMLALGVVLLAGIVGSTLYLTYQNNAYSDEVASVRRLRSTSVDLLSALQDAETGQRGYVLTREDSYLDPYNKAVGNLAQRRQALTSALVNYPQFQDRLPALNAAIDLKLGELGRTIEAARAGQMDEALAIIRGDSGQIAMDKVRDILSSIVTMSDDRLRVIVRSQLDAAANLQWVTIGSAIAIVLVVGGSILIIVQHVRDLSRAREEVEALNAGLEARVQERTEDLMRANQEIQRFAYIVTHDLRAPLVNIMGFLSELEASLAAVTAYVLADSRKPSEAEIQEARLAVEEDLPEAMSFIRSSTKKMDSLINAILKISRDGRRKLAPERVDLKATVETAAESLHHQIAAADGSVDVDIRLPPIVTDRFSIDQIIGNLFDNAVKYRSTSRPLTLKIRAATAGRGRVRIEVEDNGRGIAASDQERVFELFRRAGEQDQPGEGIGLAYVRSLTRNLGGDITVQSTEGVGSTFIIVLPADLRSVMKGIES